MPDHDAPGGQADHLGGAHIVARHLDHGRGAHRAGILHPFIDRDGEDQDHRCPCQHHVGAELGPRNAADQQRHEDGREGDEHVGDAHDDAVDHTAEITGDQAEHDAEGGGEQHRADADQHRDAQAEQDDRDEVAALIVGAEQEARIAAIHEGRRNFHVHQRIGRDVARIHRRDHRGEDHQDKHDRQNEEGDHDGHRGKTVQQGLPGHGHYFVLSRGSMKV